MADSDVSSLQALQQESQDQYIELSKASIENDMAAQQAKFAKEAAEAWSKAQ